MKRVTLGELAADRGLVGGPFGSSLVGNDYVDDGIPVIRGTNLNAGRYVGGDFVYVTEDKLRRELKRNTARPGDLIFTQRGTLGQVALVPTGGPDTYVVSQSQMRLRPAPGIADARFLYYACSTAEFVKQVEDHAISTGVPHINLGILGRLSVRLPPLDEQRAIAEVLGALDDKIAANTTLARTADELGCAIFTKAVVNANQSPLSDSAEFINGKAFTKGASGTGRVVIRIAELNSGLSGSTVYSDIAVDDKHVAYPGDILFAWSGSLTLHRWYRSDAIVNQHIFKVVPREGYPKWLVYQLVASKLERFRSIAADMATTMGHIQRRHLDETVPQLGPEEIAAIDATMSALWERALTAERENIALAELRDTLLPQLMSGKLRVRDAVSVVSVAM